MATTSFSRGLPAKLVAAVEETDGHVDMGLLGTKHVFRALSRIGRTDLAFKMLTNPTKPSPVEWMQKGGTTLWEDWGNGASRNHIMFGDFVAWAYQLPEKDGSCAAIPDVTATAFKEVTIAPQFIDALTWAKATVDGPYGTIATAWTRKGENVKFEVGTPIYKIALWILMGLLAVYLIYSVIKMIQYGRMNDREFADSRERTKKARMIKNIILLVILLALVVVFFVVYFPLLQKAFLM